MTAEQRRERWIRAALKRAPEMSAERRVRISTVLFGGSGSGTD